MLYIWIYHGGYLRNFTNSFSCKSANSTNIKINLEYSAVNFFQKTHDFFSKFYRDLNSISFFVEFIFLDSTYIRAVDFGCYFSPKITLQLILESTNRRVHMVSQIWRHQYCQEHWEYIRAVETHFKKPRYFRFFLNLKTWKVRFFRFFDFQVKFFTFSCQTL